MNFIDVVSCRQATRTAENEEEIKLDGMKIEKASRAEMPSQLFSLLQKKPDLGSLLCESALNFEKKRNRTTVRWS